MTLTRQELGRRGETLAALRLEAVGYTIVERNYRCTVGEIDIVTKLGAEWVFVEVRTRRGDKFGSPEDSIDRRKQARLIAAAECYLDEHNLPDAPWRIDIVAVEFRRDDSLLRLDIVEDAVGW